MSEESRNAGTTVPRAMFWTIMINGIIGFIAITSFIFAIPSVEDAVNDPSGFSMIYVFTLSGGTNGAICLVMIQLVLIMVGNIAFQAATARQTFAVSPLQIRLVRLLADRLASSPETEVCLSHSGLARSTQNFICQSTQSSLAPHLPSSCL